MTTSLFPDIDTLRQYVKVNVSLPFSSISPYITSARDTYLLRYFTEAFLSAVPDTDVLFLTLCRKALGPLTFYLCADEMSIQIGDSGITVQNDHEKRSPASDAKIAAAKKSLLSRGYQALSALLSYVLSSEYDYGSCPRLSRLSTLSVRDLDTFETYVSLEGSYVLFLDLLPLMYSVQVVLTSRVGAALYASLFASGADPVRRNLAQLCQSYIVYQTASLHTSTATRQQRMGAAHEDWSPVIRPLYSDIVDAGSWYATMATSALADIDAYLLANAEALGLTLTRPDTFNGPDRRIFNLHG